MVSGGYGGDPSHHLHADLLRRKKLLAAWDGEDEGISEAAEKKLSIVLWITSMGSILSFFLIAAAYSGGIESFDSDESTILFFVSVAAFLALTVEAIRVSKAGCKIS